MVTNCTSVTNWTSVATSADGIRLVAVASGGAIYTSADAGVNWGPASVTNLFSAHRRVETIPRHLAVWHDPLPRPPPHGLPGHSRVGREGGLGDRTGNRK